MAKKEKKTEKPTQKARTAGRETNEAAIQGGKIVERSIVEEMKDSYIDYSMSVIVARALPDVRDGLKPSQRRILVVMNDLGLTPSAGYRKSAKVAGDTTGNYHPHGESIVYPTMVKMAQDFNMRYTLVDGQGNFGSIDGDPPAAMRYTEARMTKITHEMLNDINKGTVIYAPNYDGTRLEPTVLPSAIPNLICNGADGIAVGMATKIPPHNLGEIIDAIDEMINKGNQWEGTAIYNTLRQDREKTEKIPKTLTETPEHYLDSYSNPENEKLEKKLDELREKLSLNQQNQEEDIPEKEGPVTLYPQFETDITVEELIEIIPGPDFPTGGLVYDQSEIMNAYANGRGRILCRAKASISETKSGKFQIIITEIPYQVNKAHMITKIADLVKNKRIEGISDIRDESNREGIRVVIDLKKASQPKTVLNKLYKYTEMQKSYNANMIALVDGQPQTLNLKQILEHFITHRIEVIIRRNEFELANAKYRAHILEGLKIALDNLDEVIKTIRNSKTQEEAKDNLIKKFELTEVQAQAILDMQLRRLAALERQKIEEEYKNVLKSIDDYEALLGAPSKIIKVVQNELKELKEKYADERRTKIYKGKVDEIEEEDLVAAEETLVTLSHGGYIKRMAPSNYKVQKRGGKGIIGATTKEGDFIEHAIMCNTHDHIVFFTNKGRAFQTRVFEIPEFSRTAKGIPAVNLIQLEQDERITAILTRSKEGIVDEDQTQEGQAEQNELLPANKYQYLFMATKNGTVKKTDISEFDKIRTSGLIAIKLESGDELKWVKPSKGDDIIILVTKNGRSIKFKEEDVRPTGRNTMGVRGIKFRSENDEVIAMDIVRADEHMLLTISEKGYGKRTELKNYPLQGRSGQGVFTFRVNEKTGELVVARILDTPDRELVLISKHGQVIRSEIGQIAKLGRQTSGVRVMKLNTGDSVGAMALVYGEDDKEAKDKSTTKKDDKGKD
ncbi:DNA gyrase subunit A [Candidatus Dojkabacteria bacterium]|nr:DNA gyrase subunit A [Candidatus Dojkabacteria bacterium]